MVVSQLFYRTTSILRSRPASWTPPQGPGRRPPAPQDARPGSPPAGLAALGSRPPASPRPGTALPPAATAGLRRGPPRWAPAIMIITTAMGAPAAVRGLRRGALPATKAIGEFGDASGGARAPRAAPPVPGSPRRAAPPRSATRDAYTPVDRYESPGGPVAHPVRPSPSPVRPSRSPGARDWIHELAGTGDAPPRYRQVRAAVPAG